MALIGGGGAGNVAGGANPSGTGSGLNYIGNYVYAYSGTYVADNASHTVIDFTSGTELIKAEIKINGAVNPTTSSVAGTNGQIKFDSQTIGAGPTSTALDAQYYYSEKVIIPPFTRVQVLINFYETDSNDIATALITGEIVG
jgi:hypothetical protein